MKKIILLLGLIVSISCVEKKENGKINLLEIEKMIEEVKKTENPILYSNLSLYLKNINSFDKLAPLAKLMSDKHNDAYASYDYYLCYSFLKKENDCDNKKDPLCHLQKENKITALKYLIKAYDKGERINSKVELERFDSKGLYVKKENGKYVLINL